MTQEEVIGFIGADPAADESALERLESQYPYYEKNYLRFLPSEKTAPILDFGCGAGGFLRYLKQVGYSNLSGFEPDTRYANFTRSHSSAEVFSEKESDAFLKENQSRFELLFLRQVLYYFPRNEIEAKFRLLAQTVRPGGILLCEVFNGAVVSGYWPWVNDPYIQTVFSESLLKTLCAQNQLEILYLGSESPVTRGLRGLVWKLARKLWGQCLRFIYILERGIDSNNPTLFGKNLILVAKRS